MRCFSAPIGLSKRKSGCVETGAIEIRYFFIYMPGMAPLCMVLIHGHRKKCVVCGYREDLDQCKKFSFAYRLVSICRDVMVKNGCTCSHNEPPPLYTIAIIFHSTLYFAADKDDPHRFLWDKSICSHSIGWSCSVTWSSDRCCYLCTIIQSTWSQLASMVIEMTACWCSFLFLSRVHKHNCRHQWRCIINSL